MTRICVLCATLVVWLVPLFLSAAQKSFQQTNLPIGAIFPVLSIDSSIVMKGYVPCDGRLLRVSDYPRLFAVLGFQYGRSCDSSGNYSFGVPDLRGMFLRGYNHSVSDSSEILYRDRTFALPGSNVIGAYQLDAIAKHRHIDAGHTHPIFAISPGVSDNSDDRHVVIPGNISTTNTGHANLGDAAQLEGGQPIRTSHETRPMNFHVAYVIACR